MLEIITRDEAELRGKKRFYTGVRCLRGHDSERFVSNGGCVACICRKTPKKTRANGFMFWPARPVSFAMYSGVLPGAEEAEAVLLAFEKWGWQYTILDKLRADPVLLEQLKAEIAGMGK